MRRQNALVLVLLLIITFATLLGIPAYNRVARANQQGNNYDKLPVLPWGLALIGPLLLAVSLFFEVAVQVNAGTVGIVTRFGAVTGTVFEQGLHFKAPYIEDVTVFDVRVQKEQVKAAAASKDLQEVHADVALNYHLDASQASVVFQTIGPFYKDRVIDPAIQEAFKASNAQFTAEELITQRELVKTKAREAMRVQLEKSHVIVDDLNITNFDFSKEFNAAIEAKQVASQNVQQAQRTLEKAQVDAQQRVATATADANSVKLAADAAAYQVKASADAQAYAQEKLKANLDDKYLRYLEILNQQAAIKGWDGKLSQYSLGSSSTFLNLPGQQQPAQQQQPPAK